ncbi:TorF family putative porin [Pseudomonadota bacterium]
MSITGSRIAKLCLALFFFSGFVQKASGEGLWSESKVSLDVTYASKYIARRGVDFFGDGPAIHPNLTVSFGETGVYTGIWAAIPVENGCRDPFGDKCADWIEYDFYAGYGQTLWKEATFATVYDLSYAYLYYPKQTRQDQHAIGLKFTHPNVLPVIGPSRPYPYWGLYYTWRVFNVGRDYREALLGIGYDIPVFSHTASTFVDAIWGDGPGGSINSQGITRVRTGISTSFELGGLTLTPALIYQAAKKETNPRSWLESELWFKLKVSFSQ